MLPIHYLGIEAGFWVYSPIVVITLINFFLYMFCSAQVVHFVTNCLVADYNSIIVTLMKCHDSQVFMHSTDLLILWYTVAS